VPRFDGDDVIFNGQKMYCTLGEISPYIMLMTRDPQVENPYEGISMWLLPTDTPGVRFSKISKVGWWSIPTYEVHIQDARVPKSNLIGEMNKGWPQLMANFEIERLALCAASLGQRKAPMKMPPPMPISACSLANRLAVTRRCST
jgi:crotonobetainyl-CoA dehydrogenase